MAASQLPRLTVFQASSSEYGSDIEYHSPQASEYGSDFDLEEEALVGELLAQIAATAPVDNSLKNAVVYAGVEDENVPKPEVLQCASSSPPVPSSVNPADRNCSSSSAKRRSVSVEVEYDTPSRYHWRVSRNGIDAARSQPLPPSEDIVDARSPLERFRTKPKKPLSVTDLISPAWCELQYWYNLTKFGRKPQTKAMRQGSKVHRILEEQVHQVVPVQVTSKEDAFGLRIWNAIQGLRTLKETGLTRELEIWGIIDGEVVNGVIDEVTFVCPDPEFEEAIKQSRMADKGGALPPDQMSLMQYLSKAGDQSSSAGSGSALRKVYIGDVKTRGFKSIPTGANLRPTIMQLMLYRKVLESLALNNVDADTVLQRYSLQPLEPFTDSFMQQLRDMTIGLVDDSSPPGTESVIENAPISDIESHNHLSALWSLMISEYKDTMTLFSDLLRAEFRYSRTGEVIGSETFAYDTGVVDDYIADEMSWWKGQRDTRGVEIEEAFKCRTCNFADDCTWRKNKIEEATEKHRLRATARQSSAI